MSSSSTCIREAIIERLSGQDWLPVRTLRRQPMPQLRVESLPALLVVIADETETPEDEANTGPPRFMSETVIGISVVTGEAAPQQLDADLDDLIDRIRSHLLTDPTFVRGINPSKGRDDPDRYPLFEAVSKVRRGRFFPQGGETYLAEGRLELSFLFRTAYDPVIPDQLEGIGITARLAGATPKTPPVRGRVDIPQT